MPAIQIKNRDAFPEILSIHDRIDGTAYLVKVDDPKNRYGYDLVTVVVAHNGMRHLKSAGCSRITPSTASKIVTRYMGAL